ncbi:MAG: hypothetical protein R3C53_06440 [Pirellulaceae bacterium]
MLSGVSVSCFLLSYLVVLIVEVLRFTMQVPARKLLLIGMMSAGLLAHSIFLFYQFSAVAISSDNPQLLSNWFQWSVLAAWALALACLGFIVRNPNGSVGLFLIPQILILIGVASLVRDAAPFERETTITLWRSIHGVSLMMGTTFISLGLAFGVMYLLQSYRLKSKKRPSQKFRLPALEFLQSMNRMTLFASAIALGCGFISGVVLNFNRAGQIDWFSGSILFTFAIFVWLLMASVMEFTAVGSLGGRRSAYLVIANFLFLVVVLSFVLLSSHAQPEPREEATRKTWSMASESAVQANWEAVV